MTRNDFSGCKSNEFPLMGQTWSRWKKEFLVSSSLNLDCSLARWAPDVGRLKNNTNKLFVSDSWLRTHVKLIIIFMPQPSQINSLDVKSFRPPSLCENRKWWWQQQQQKKNIKFSIVNNDNDLSRNPKNESAEYHVIDWWTLEVAESRCVADRLRDCPSSRKKTTR